MCRTPGSQSGAGMDARFRVWALTYPGFRNYRPTTALRFTYVIPAKAGIHLAIQHAEPPLDSRFRGNDDQG
jgi:hypothetical protein